MKQIVPQQSDPDMPFPVRYLCDLIEVLADGALNQISVNGFQIDENNMVLLGEDTLGPGMVKFFRYPQKAIGGIVIGTHYGNVIMNNIFPDEGGEGVMVTLPQVMRSAWRIHHGDDYLTTSQIAWFYQSPTNNIGVRFQQGMVDFGQPFRMPELAPSEVSSLLISIVDWMKSNVGDYELEFNPDWFRDGGLQKFTGLIDGPSSPMLQPGEYRWFFAKNIPQKPKGIVIGSRWGNIVVYRWLMPSVMQWRVCAEVPEEIRMLQLFSILEINVEQLKLIWNDGNTLGARLECLMETQTQQEAFEHSWTELKKVLLATGHCQRDSINNMEKTFEVDAGFFEVYMKDTINEPYRPFSRGFRVLNERKVLDDEQRFVVSRILRIRFSRFYK